MADKSKLKKLDAWKKAFQANYKAAAKAAGLKDSVGSVTGARGQKLSQAARLKTNKQMGYTEKSVMP